MMKLKKFYKPFLVSMLAAVVLLFGQAMCDLKLPDTMSDIINVGIQQNGIEHASPDVISEQGMIGICPDTVHVPCQHAGGYDMGAASDSGQALLRQQRGGAVHDAELCGNVSYGLSGT